MNAFKTICLVLVAVILALGTLGGCVWSASLLATGSAVLAVDSLSSCACTELALGS